MIQEEITQKTVALAIRTASLTNRELQRAMRVVLEMEKKAKVKAVPKGKQTMGQLKKQNAALATVDISSENIKGFEKTARKYNIDYALMKDKSSTPPMYVVFFKGRDADSMTAAFKEFSSKTIKDNDRESVKKQLDDIQKSMAKKDVQQTRAPKHKRQKVKAQVKLPEITR